MTIQFGIIADPIGRFDPISETTFFLLREICRRGHVAWIMEPKDLAARPEGLTARARRVEVSRKGDNFLYKIVEEREVSLASLHSILVRKDPPVDLNYLEHLFLLQHLERTHPRILWLNSPSGILSANEKIYPLHFPGISPPTLVSCERRALFAFLHKQKHVVVKPLGGSGGRGIFLLKTTDRDAASLLESATENFSRTVILQKFLPESREGDKRILLFRGEPLGAFLRKPTRGDFRGNLHSGARAVKATITAHERRVIEKIRPRLLADGLFFVGIDFIGRHVTEINTTSPMGVGEINRLYGTHVEQKIVDWVESRLGGLKGGIFDLVTLRPFEKLARSFREYDRGRQTATKKPIEKGRSTGQ